MVPGLSLAVLAYHAVKAVGLAINLVAFPTLRPGGVGGLRTSLLVPARDAMSNGEYDIAAGALDEVLRRDPLMPEARRLLGVCQAAMGRFSQALETWHSWTRLGPRSPGEEAEAPSVERMRRAVEMLMK